MCAKRTKRANEPHMMPETPERRLNADDVLRRIVEAAKGMLLLLRIPLVEKLPYDPATKKKLPWGHIGRRVGSLNSHHAAGVRRNHVPTWPNRLWCNTWHCERVAGATDHGGLQLTGP